MIYKSLSRRGTGSQQQLLNYLLRYNLKEKSIQRREDVVVILKHNLRTDNVKSIANEFTINNSFRVYNRKSSVVVYHDILSFAPASKKNISKKILTEIAKKYVSLRGEDQLYYIVAHLEKEHTHLHAMVSGVKTNGLAARVSKIEFARLKNDLEKFQEKYIELKDSKIDHLKCRTQSKQQIIEAVTNIRQTHKQSLVTTLQNTYTVAQSQKDFIHRLQEQQVQLYYRNNRLQGAIVEDRKFRFSRFGYTDEKIKELDEREAEQQALSELGGLRKGKSPRLEKTKPASSKATIDPEEMVLEELRAMRTKQQLNQSPERVIDIDGNDLPKVPSLPGMRIVDDINPYLDMTYDFDDSQYNNEQD